MQADELALRNDFNKSVEYLNKGNYKRAFTLLKKCLSVRQFKEAYLNIGNCHRFFGEDTKMVDAYLRACDPKVPFIEGTYAEVYPAALNNLGLAYFMRGDDDLAIECYNKAITYDDKFWDAWWNCSTAVLRKASSGQVELFKDGWEMYDARFLKTPPIKLKNDVVGLQYWDRVSSGESIVVLAEQGIGDAIMWGRYLPLLASKFKNVYIQADENTRSLFKDYKTVFHVSECDAEVAIPICALSKCFEEIPSGDWLRGKYGVREFDDKEKLNVGIVWAGSPSHANDRNRSTNIHRFHVLSKYVNLYALSPGFKSTKYVTGLDIKNWEDTACAINGLDLVISVDTSVAHMAGSLGGEVWLLQPTKETDFRWGNGVTRSVWYDNVRIFNNSGSWEDVFDDVLVALKDKLYL